MHVVRCIRKIEYRLSQITLMLDPLRGSISKESIADVCSEPCELVQLYEKGMSTILEYV